MMESNNIIQLIKDKMGTFSRQQLKIASYLVENHKHAGFLTATKLAEAAGVSQPTVIRFTQSLGFSQYQQFVDAFRQLFKNDLTSTERLNISLEHETDGNGILLECISREMDTLKRLIKEFPQKQLDVIVGQIVACDDIFIVGTRGTAFLAQNFAYFLGKVKKNVTPILNGGTDAFDPLVHAGKNALVIILAFPRYPRETIEIATYCHGNKMNVIGICDKIDSPLTPNVSKLFVLPITFSTLFDSYCSVLCLFSAIVTQVGRSNREESKILSQSFEKLAKEKQIFL